VKPGIVADQPRAPTDKADDAGGNPQAHFAEMLTKLVNLWPESRLNELMPWAWVQPIGSQREPQGVRHRATDV
jgi:hypothetical protein